MKFLNAFTPLWLRVWLHSLDQDDPEGRCIDIDCDCHNVRP